MGFINRVKGEEPSIFAKVPHLLQGKGHYGEYLSDYALLHGDIPGRKQTFCNVYVPSRGRTAEIDVVMLHETGVYVFGSKNYSGWIFGSENQKEWTQSLKGGAKNRFYNPIRQNRSHIRALAAYLGLPESAFHSFIVFSERCELKKVPGDAEDFTILRRHHLVACVKRVVAAREVLFDWSKFDELAAKLAAAGKTDGLAREHVETVKGIQNGTICPWCGARLVERSGKYGRFMGCSSYPKCRYTADID